MVESRRGRTKPDRVVGAYGGGCRSFNDLEECEAGGWAWAKLFDLKLDCCRRL